MNAIDSYNFDVAHIRGEARRYCDQQGLTDIKDYEHVYRAIAHRYFLERIEPYIQMAGRLRAFKLPKVMIHQDGRIESHYEWSDEEKKMFAQIDELIAGEAVKLGLTPTTPPPPQSPPAPESATAQPGSTGPASR